MTSYPGPPTGHIDHTPQGRRLVVERTFDAPIGEVWASLTEPERVARWYGTVEGEPVAGRTIMITMTAEEGAPAEPALVVECDPPRRFLIETAGAGDPWRLQVELIETDGTTTMTFTQMLADELDAADIGPGWEYYADRHHAVVHGNALPDWTSDRYQEILGPHYRLG
ncbi:MAG: SRPBCC domain-containing protein [Ilumatobacter sp.]|uniref:SRPBCC domain-containing protein n=1 Tax=Ilumatobacter sp. TaxID=1967498 RepID=UPI003298EF63